MMSHHSVMMSSLHINIIKIDKFGDFLCDIDYNSRTNVFRDVISLIINQCDPRRPKGASGGHKVSASRAAQASEARLLENKTPYRILFGREHVQVFGIPDEIATDVTTEEEMNQ